jgi:gliding motility-associated-like protein
MRFHAIIVFLVLLCPLTGFSQGTLLANAGPNFSTCPGSTVVIGASASGGQTPYTFSWSPSTGLSSSTVSNPTLAASVTQTFVLLVTDANDKKAYDTLIVTVPNLAQYTAGDNVNSCSGKTVTIGNPANASATGFTFSWSPSTGLNNASAPNPTVTPVTPTVYSLTVSKGSCSLKTGTVLVSLNGLPLDLIHDTTIYEGMTITLIATSTASNYNWSPNYYIQYANTNAPDVSPLKTTVYTVTAIDANGCFTSDTVRVKVIPSDEPVFYSAFTPNGDGSNDFFYIGNVLKFPDNVLKIYNRYGQVIYTSAGYKNDWDGSYQGNKVPTGTYFYVFDTGTDRGKYKGTVTILR